MSTKILLVDDDPLMHQLYQHQIERAGYRLIAATNGREGVEMAVREAPQVVLMDIMMPEMDGLTAVLELKKKESTKGIPVIVITANSQFYLHKREFTEVGAASFLPKPFGATQLLDAIRGVMAPAR